MKLIIFILSILSWDIVKVASEVCNKPEVRRDLMHIYRTADVDVTVYRCHNAGRYAYSDITKNCINAFKTRLFIDKWTDENDVGAADSPVKLEKYTTKANTMQNEIRLRSGTVCRYDRGFCYDPKESINYAVVWEVTREKTDINVEDLIEIFYGWIDSWQLKNNSLKYLVFQDSQKDRSFFLQLVQHDKFGDKDLWYTNRNGIIASQESLKRNIRPVPRLNQEYFPLKPKQFVSEEILRNCDLQKFPLDVIQNTYQDYILDQNNLVVILDLFQKQILETNKKLAVIPSRDKENAANDKAIIDLQKDMRNTKKSLLTKNQELAEIRATINSMLNSLNHADSDISKLLEKIKQIFAQKQDNDVELGKINEKLMVLQNQLSKLGDDSNRNELNKEIFILKSNFTLLETILLEKNKDVLKILSSKDKLIDDIKNNLINVHKELKNKDGELTKEQESISNRLFNIELDLNRQNNDLEKFQNYTNLILTQKQNYFNTNVKDFDKLELKYNAILAKLNLHDIEIGKCENYTTFLLTNKDKWLGVIEDDIRKTQKAVLQSEGKITDLLNNDIELEKKVYEVDGRAKKLKENNAREHREIIAMVNDNKNEIETIKEKSEQCRRDVNHIMNSRGEDSEELQRNLTDVQNILFKQDEDILKLQETSKEIYDKLSENDKDFNEAISECKSYVNKRLQTKDEEITQIHDILIKKDREIKKLAENFNIIVEKNKDLENKINMCCQVDIDKKLKEKDNEIKQIKETLEKKFNEELSKRDFLTSTTLKNLDNRIKSFEQVVPPV